MRRAFNSIIICARGIRVHESVCLCSFFLGLLTLVGWLVAGLLDAILSKIVSVRTVNACVFRNET